MARTCDAFNAAVFGLPLYRPLACALRIPSRCRSSVISRSNCAKPAKIVRMSLPVADFRINRLAAEVQDFPQRGAAILNSVSSRLTISQRPVVDRASRSTLQTTNVSPPRR